MQPLEVPLANGGEAFWLDTRTIAHAVDEGEGKDKVKAPAYGPITEGKAPVPISKKGKSVQA